MEFESLIFTGLEIPRDYISIKVIYYIVRTKHI